jgi:dUTP pyrophosphatase
MVVDKEPARRVTRRFSLWYILQCMEIKVKKLDKKAIIPQYAHDTDAGMDFFALEDTTIFAQASATVPTGIAVEIPTGYVGLVWDKSGLASKEGITTMAGVIDSGFRGAMSLIVFNTTDKDYTFKAGEKVAQMLVQKVEHVGIIAVDKLSDTQRGEKGFGSTGK